ncbi:MAG: WbqC family protein [Saprospiraceae bacterium]|nr:WbqC family protein [Saprospiraceae bacterium]
MEQSYRNLLIHTTAFPDIHLAAYLSQLPKLIIEINENYQKKSTRNRYNLGSHQGTHTLSIPLEKGKNQQKNIREVRIFQQSDWRIQHQRYLQTVYGRSPYFEYYRDELDYLYSNQTTSLFEWNQTSLQQLSKWLKWNFQIEFTESFKLNYPSDTLDLRNQTKANQFAPNPYYEQLFGTIFIPHLSVLDLIFHLGPEAELYLKNYKPVPISGTSALRQDSGSAF